MLQHGLGVKMFCHQVRRVGRASDLRDVELLGQYSFLYPQVLHLEVAQFAKPVSSRNADSGARITVDFATHVVSEVHEHGDDSQDMRAPLDHGEKLSLA